MSRLLTNTECLRAIANEAHEQTIILESISRRLAVIADVMSGAQEPTKTSEEAKKLADEAFERIMRGDLTGGRAHE